MGALVTLELPDDSPALELPWIITFGPLDDDDGWEPVVCGPYERPHALALAEAVVADEDLMAVVEPLLPHVSVDEIRGEIAAARLAVEEDEPDDDLDGFEAEPEAHEHERVSVPSAPPDPEEIRAGLDRIAARLSTYAP
jgi:hypothetical protein